MANIQIGNGTTTFYARKAGATYEMQTGRSIVTSDFGIDAGGAAKGREIVIDGEVKATLAAIRLGTNDGASASVELTIGKDGLLSSNHNALVAHAEGHFIRNAGDITGGTTGISSYGANTIVNTGLIDSPNVGVDMIGVDGHGGILRNSGKIDSQDMSVRGGAFGDVVVNSGTLTGDVVLGMGDDRFTFKAGEVDGTVRGGSGNDTYVIAKTGLLIGEVTGQGWDTVRARVDHGLADNVEVLRLTGKADLDGVGNGGNNQLFGNVGENVLYGAFGDDVMNGGKGDDILTGASGADEFHFSRGTGTDYILDYEAGSDEIHFHGLKGATDFADMMAHHVTETDGDVWIEYGKDVIVIKDTSRASLEGGDFVFM